ncbi:hypothetical protein HRbin04_00770 [archaeon HR04]|nr:hypothetical protein HRbin04_00770 [archaeon HR04]
MLKVAKGLVITALALLIIYGVDEAVSRSMEGEGADETGFLPTNAMVRGLAFGGSAIALSIATFFIAREVSTFVWIMLIINGVLIAIGGAVAGSAPVTGLGAVVIALGIIKRFRDAKIARMV